MNIQRLRNPPEPVCYHNSMNVKPIVNHHVPQVLLGSLENGKVRNENPFRKQRSPSGDLGFLTVLVANRPYHLRISLSICWVFAPIEPGNWENRKETNKHPNLYRFVVEPIAP